MSKSNTEKKSSKEKSTEQSSTSKSQEFEFDKEKHQYKIDGIVVPSVTQVLSAAGIIPKYNGPAFYSEKGTKVHLLTEYYDKKELDETSIDPQLHPYFSAYKDFLSQNNWVNDQIEIPLYSKKHGFAGTPDRVGYLNGTETILDIKTSVPKKYHGLQLAGYCILLPLDHLVQGRQRVGLYLTEEGKYSMVRYEGGLYEDRVFLSCLEIYRWKNGK